MRGMKVGISAVSYFLPPAVETVEQLAQEFPEWSIEKIATKTGINRRHIAGSDVCSSDLALESARILFDEHHIDPADVDFVLLCTQSPDYLLPTTACLLQDRLGIPQTAGALDFNLGCSGFIYGLGLAGGLIQSNQADKVLLITAETYSKFISSKDKSVRSIFGDAAASTLIPRADNSSLGPIIYGTDGAGAKHLMLKVGGMRYPRVADVSPPVIDQYGNLHDEACLIMNGQEVFNFTLKVVPAAVEALLDKAGFQQEQVDYFIFHQANRFMLETLRKKLRIPEDRFCICLEHCGNTVSSTIPIALAHALKEGRVHSGSRVMLVGFGVGLSWGAVLVEF